MGKTFRLLLKVTGFAAASLLAGWSARAADVPAATAPTPTSAPVSDEAKLRQALKIVGHWEATGDLGKSKAWALELVTGPAAHAPAVVNFFRIALATRFQAALLDVSRSGEHGVWDASLLEPMLGGIEEDVQHPIDPTAGPAHDGTVPVKHSASERAFVLITWHPEAWADTTLRPRLAHAMLLVYPVPTDGPVGPPTSIAEGIKNFFHSLFTHPVPSKMGPQNLSNLMSSIAKAHDPTLAKVLRPYLKDMDLDGNRMIAERMIAGPTTSDRWTPLRVCDHARLAIYELLGNSRESRGLGWTRATSMAPYIPRPGVYPERWITWDKKNAELEKRLADPTFTVAARPGR